MKGLHTEEIERKVWEKYKRINRFLNQKDTKEIFSTYLSMPPLQGGGRLPESKPNNDLGRIANLFAVWCSQ